MSSIEQGNQLVGVDRLQALAREVTGSNATFNNQAAALGAYARHAYEISGYHEGTPLRAYMDENDAAVSETFVELAADRGNPNSTHLMMRNHRIPGHNVWQPPHRTMSSWSLTQGFWYPVTWEGDGWPIGNLGVHQMPQVMLCTDGLLRNLRSPEHLPKSRGHGWGQLPDVDKMRPALMSYKTPLHRRPPVPLEEFLAKYLKVPLR